MLKKFFILRFLLSFSLFALSFLLFKFIQFLIPIKLLASLMGLCVAVIVSYFLSSILRAVIDFMQIYYSYNPNQDISPLSFSTLLQALKSLFEKDNCYLKLLSNLKRANTAMQEKLYDSIEEDNPYYYLLEFRSNSLFKYFFDRITNNIIICTFYYVVKTDSDLELEDYAKGAVFYYKVFPYLLESTFKGVILINSVAFISYLITFLVTLSIYLLPFFFIFHKMIISFVVNNYILFSLMRLTTSNENTDEVIEEVVAEDEIEKTEQSDNITNHTECAIAKQNVQSNKRKSSLSDIAKTKPANSNDDFSMTNKLSSFQSTGQSGLNSLLTQWKNNNSPKEESVTQVKSTHKYFKLDEEQLKQMTSSNDSDCTSISNEQISHEDFFLISDISTEVKNLNIDFLLHIDEY